MRRSGIVLVFFGVHIAACAAIDRATITFEYVRELAVQRVREAYRPPARDLPARMAGLNYDDYRRLQFRPQASLWRESGLRFEAQFFPRGGLHQDRVLFHEFSATHVQAIPFRSDWFAIAGIDGLRSLPDDLGYAGFKIFHPLDRPDRLNEILSFLGASYFRALGADQQYGLSARGLALDSAIDGRTEEFPRLSEFWLGRPAPDATALTFFALLEGPSIAGAYEFVVTPGRATYVDVRAFLAFRSGGKVLGLAPLTSMFWYGENSHRPESEKRPEVHDSDGLLLEQEDGARIWRPLRNPPKNETVDLSVRNVVRFGLLQRDRRAAHYADGEAHYERRPSAWIEPRKNWGAGKVRLVQLPTKDEYADNVITYWIPEASPPPGGYLETHYRIVWSLDEPAVPNVAHLLATREETRAGGEGGVLFRLDFGGSPAASRRWNEVKAEVEVGPGGRLVGSSLTPYPESGGCQVVLEIAATGREPVELRCRLRNNGGATSETWLYSWNPNP